MPISRRGVKGGMEEKAQRRTIRVIAATEVVRALSMTEAINVMKQAFIYISSGEAVLPLRTHIDIPRFGGSALFMPSYLPDAGRFGVKMSSLFSANPDKGLPRIQSLVILADGTTGSPLAVLDGSSLTAIRTGAASGAATDFLSRREAAVAAVFGAGVQGRTQLEAVCCVRSIREAHVFDPNMEAAAAFAREMSECLGIRVRAMAAPDASVRSADVICTATAARTPVFNDADLKPGVHINAVGSYSPDVREIPGETVGRSRIVVDHRESAFSEAGDLIIPLRQGILRESDLQTELGEVLSGKKPGRISDEEVTLFKSVGVGIQDLLAAAAVLQRAEELGLGTVTSL